MNIVCICKMHFCFMAATTFWFAFVALGATRNTGAATITAFRMPPSFTSPPKVLPKRCACDGDGA